MKIKVRNIEELIEAEYNPRKLTKTQAKSLKDSLTRFGVVDPVLVNMHPDRKNIIIGGHQRTRVWHEMGNTTIPCIELKLTLEQERELNVRLNKNTGEFDEEMLVDFFTETELIDWGFDDVSFFSNDIDDLEDGEEIEIPQSVQLQPPMEYIVIMCEPNSEEWEELKMRLGLRIVRRGGYKKGSAFDSTSLERVLKYNDFVSRYDSSSTE